MKSYFFLVRIVTGPRRYSVTTSVGQIIPLSLGTCLVCTTIQVIRLIRYFIPSPCTISILCLISRLVGIWAALSVWYFNGFWTILFFFDMFGPFVIPAFFLSLFLHFSLLFPPPSFCALYNYPWEGFSIPLIL